MKNSAGCVMAAVAATLVMCGCASTGGVDNAGPIKVAAAPVLAPPVNAVPIPKDAKGKPVVRADTKENFEAIAAAIRQQMQAGGRWQYMNKDERATINQSFANMGTLYDKFGTVEKMDQPARMQLLADQSTVNSILTRRDGERLICRSEMPVGSHLPVKTCRTYAQMQADERNAQESLRQMSETMQRASGG